MWRVKLEIVPGRSGTGGPMAATVVSLHCSCSFKKKTHTLGFENRLQAGAAFKKLA